MEAALIAISSGVPMRPKGIYSIARALVNICKEYELSGYGFRVRFGYYT